jgi:hypothetical protein
MSRPVRLLLPLGAVRLAGAALLGAGPAAAGPGPIATAAAFCAKHGNHGFTYLYPFHVRHTSCRTGRKVISGYRSCLRHGHSTCRTHRYRCHRRITASSPVQYNANVACKHRRKRVRFHYTQNK